MNRAVIAARTALSVVGACLAMLGPTQAAAQTAFTTGAVEVRAFLARSTTSVYAAAYGGGLYRSSDQGSSWTRIDMPADEHYLTSIAGNSAAYLVVGADEGLLRSSDGVTFTRTLSEPVSAVAVAPGSSNVVLAGIRGLGILRSTDAGVTFTAADNAGFDSLDIVTIAFHPSDGNTVYAAARPDGAGNRGGVFRSTNGGSTWASFGGLPAGNNFVSSLAIDSSGTVYAGVLRPSDGAGDVYSRAAGAGSWTASGDLFGVISLHRDANATTTIWAGSRGLGLLSGSGTSFNYAFSHDGVSPNLFFTGINAVATIPGSQVVLKAIRGAGVWRSASGSLPRTNWTRVSGLQGADRVLSASGLGGSASTIFAGLYAGGVWRSNNNGLTFDPPTVNASQADFSFGANAGLVYPFVSIWDLAASANAGGPVYAATGGVGMFYLNDNAGVFRFDGTRWQGVGQPNTSAPWNGVVESGMAIPSVQVYGVAVNRGNDQIAYAGYLGNGFGMFRRTTGPIQWNSIAAPGVLTPQIRGFVTSAASTSRILALPFDDKAVLSNDSGVVYAPVSVSQTGFERLRFFAAAENPGNSSQWVGATNKGIYISADAGASWLRVNMAGVFANQAVSAVGFKGSRAFAADLDGNRYCSANGGATWVSAGAKLRAGVNAIRTIGGNLYYLTDGAGFYREDGTC